MKISIIFPVLNEENRLENGIRKTIEYFEKNRLNVEYELIISDNGSVDKTEMISRRLEHEFSRVKYLKLNQKGVGYAFREGAKISTGDIVGYMDIDLATDLSAIELTLKKIQNEGKDIVNSSRYHKDSIVIGRPLFREIISRGNIILVNLFLGTKLTDYMCGFKFFKKEVLLKLIKVCSKEKGWFFCAELLVVGKWLGYSVEDIPIKWVDERKHSKVDSQILKLSMNYIRNMIKIRKRKKEYIIRASK